MKKINFNEVIKEIIILTAAVAIIAAAVYFFLVPSHTAVSSISGLGIVLSNFVPLPLSAITMILNVVLLIIGFLTCGREFGVKSVLASLLLPMYLRIFEILTPHVESLSGNIVIDLVCFMIVVGAGQAVLFNMNASSGGSDIIALVLKKYTNVSIGTALMVVDFIVVIVTFFVYGVTVGLFSLAGFLAKSFFIDTVIETLNLCKYFTIISKNAEPICIYINKELNHGATIYEARGAYTKDYKQVVMTVVKREQARNLRNYVHKVDPDAFMMITNSSEIIGKGFIE